MKTLPLRPALGLTAVFVALALAFPYLVWVVGQLAFPSQAGGSLLRGTDGKVLGSALLGQSFVARRYFHGRPSAAGAGYDAANSSGSNLGPTSKKLIDGAADDPATTNSDETFLGFRQLAAQYRRENGLSPDAQIPADAATRSASGLDPEISPKSALLQLDRVAKARGLARARVEQIVLNHTSGRWLGILGEPRVNVLQLNLALDAM